MTLPLRTYWPRQPPHFSYTLTGAILGRFNIDLEWSPLPRAELLGVGATLDNLPDDSTAIILGAGFRFAEAIVCLPRLRCYAVRGQLTADKLELPPGAVLADLSLLADILVKPTAPAEVVGLVGDGANPKLVQLCTRHTGRLVLIDHRTADAAMVISQIAGCRAILSTSAAGLAVAWGCGIPATAVHLGEHASSPHFEWRDFFSAFGLPAILHDLVADDAPERLAGLCLPPPAAIPEKKAQLREAIRRARNDLPDRPATHSSPSLHAPTATLHRAATNALDDERPETAARLLQAAIAAEPGNASLHRDLGRAWTELGERSAAIAALLRATKLDPADASAAALLGRNFHEGRQAELALTAFTAAKRAAPDSAEIRNKHAMALINVGRLDDGLAELRELTRNFPDFRKAHDNLLYYLQLHPACDRATLRAERAEWHRRHAAPFSGQLRSHANLPAPHRPLNIGYVSPDFRRHAATFFTLPLFSHHDREQFRVFAYCLNRERDLQTHLLRAHVSQWRDVGGLSDDDVADLIRADGIDILVDLSHHMGGNRLPVFARKPAPLQVSWIGYPGGTGLETIDYRLTDRYLDPPGMGDDTIFEKPFRLRDSYWCYDPLSQGARISSLPAAATGHVTFGCLNAFAKVNDPTLALWARVLRAVPHSRLILLAPAGTALSRVRATLAREDVSPERIVPTSRLPRARYLALHERIDIALDPIPVGGHTTICDGLWMGVPTVTLPAETAISRGGLSLLSQVGLGDWVAASLDDYVQIAVEKARDRSCLAELRRGLRARFQASVLMDAPRFARSIEDAYRTMWQTWCSTNHRNKRPG